MTLPLLRQENSPEVGMPREFDPEHIEHLAFQPIRSPVHARSALRPEPVGYGRLDPDSLIPREAVEDIDQVETFGPLGPIHRCDIHQVVEIRLKLQILDDGNYCVVLHYKKALPYVTASFDNAVTEL